MLEDDCNSQGTVVGSNPIFQYWWFHLPNLLLAAVMYTMLGRFLLSIIAGPDSKIYIMRGFVKITDPFLRPIRYLTPQAVPPMFVLLLATVWIFTARVIFYVVLLSAGLAPGTGVAPQ